MRILITGTAGFIGFHLARKLLSEGHSVFGLDNINDYYDVNLKFDRLKISGINTAEIEYGKTVSASNGAEYRFIKGNLEDKILINSVFSDFRPEVVINLAAQAGVRYSLTNPEVYISSNIEGFLNILEACRKYPVSHLLYASSSSVYGLNQKMPFSVHEGADHPVSLYAASKKTNEMMAHTYSHLFGIPSTGLRFFTVYGPWGRPDMALFIFTSAILNGKPLQVFNNGDMERDFTYVDDIVNGISRMVGAPPSINEEWDRLNPDPSSSSAPYRIYNIGNSRPVKLMDFIRAIEEKTGKKAILEYLPLQAGDVRKTWADTDDLKKEFDYSPGTPVSYGIGKFVDWYTKYYSVK